MTAQGLRLAKLKHMHIPQKLAAALHGTPGARCKPIEAGGVFVSSTHLVPIPARPAVLDCEWEKVRKVK
jgi:hypothetical protein